LNSTEPVSKPISLQKTSINVDSEIRQIDAPAGGEQIYISTSNSICCFEHDGGNLRKLHDSPEMIDGFAVLTSDERLVYLSNGFFHLCNKQGRAIESIPVEGELVLRAIDFSLFPSKEQIVFIGESAELGPGGPDIPAYRICLLDLKTGKMSLLSRGLYSTVPKLMGWRGEDVLILNEDTGDFLLVSTKTNYEQLISPVFSSQYEEGALESVAFNRDGTLMAFSIAYPIDRVQIFINETWKSRMICELEGEGGVRNALLFSPNSPWVSYTNSWLSSPALCLIPTTSGGPRALEASSLGLESRVSWLPQGDGIVFSDESIINILKSSELVAKQPHPKAVPS